MAKGEVRYRLVLDSKEFTGGIKVAEKEFQGFLTQLSGGAGALGNVAAAMGPVGLAAAAAFGAATIAVGAFAKATIDGAVAAVKFAGNISDLSTKTGISGEALQVLGVAGQQVGVSMEDAATAVKKMQQAMVAAPENFKQLGLAVSDLQKLAPEKQFEAVGKAIQSIQDPAQRTAATIAFFGKNGQEAMKLLSVDMEKAGEQAMALGNIMSDSTRLALDALGDSATVLNTTWEHLWMNIGGAIAETPEVRQAIEAVTEALGDLSRFIQLNSKEIQEFVRQAVVPLGRDLALLLRGVQFMVNAFIQWNNKINEVKASLRGGWIEAAVRAMGGSLGGPTGSVSVAPPGYEYGPPKPGGPGPTWTDPAELAKRQKAVEAANAKEIAEALKMKAFWTDFYNDSAKIAIGHWEAMMKNEERIASDRSAAMAKRFLEELDMAQNHSAAMIASNAKAWAMVEEAERAADSALHLGNVLRMLPGILEDIGISADSALGQLASGFAEAAEGAIALFAGLASGNPAQIIQGIAGIGRAIKGLSESQNAWVRASAMIINAPLGLAGLIFGGGGPSAAERLAHDIMVVRTETINAAGGIDVLAINAARAGVSLDALWNARTVEEYERAIDRVNAAIALHESAVDKTKEAMDRWGLSAADMGDEFAQQLLHEQFIELYQDIRLLSEAGADMSVILGRDFLAAINEAVAGGKSFEEAVQAAIAAGGNMGAEINALVQQSIAAGVALPETMRDFIKHLIEMGLLFDENGQKITDISQLEFTESLEAGVSRLIDKIEELVNALLGIPSEVNTMVKVTTVGGPTSSGGDGGSPEPPTQAATGYYNPSIPQDQLFQAHAGEEVSITPPGGRGGGASQMPSRFTLVLPNGREIDTYVQERIGTGHIAVAPPR